MDYNNGKIYKIASDLTDKIYIGSTTQSLAKRHYKHKKSYQQYINGCYHNVSSFELIKLGNTDIILLENFPCNNKEELHARERYYIEQNKAICVNIRTPGRTDREYYNENKDAIKEHKKQYYNDNQEKILEKKKEYYHNNKEQIAEKNKEQIMCECGSSIRKKELFRHYKSKKHINFINQQQSNN